MKATSGEIRQAASTPIFASSSSGPVKARLAIRKETVKPTPAAVPVPSRPGQVIVSLPPPTDLAHRRPRRQPRPEEDAERLADHVAGDDADRDRRADRVGEQAAGDVDARVGEREERHDHVAGPGVEGVLDALVRRDRLGEAAPRGRGEPGGRLLAELAGEVGGPLELVARAAGRRWSPGRSRGRRSPGRSPTHTAPPRSRCRRGPRAARASSAGSAAVPAPRRGRPRSPAPSGRSSRCRR